MNHAQETYENPADKVKRLNAARKLANDARRRLNVPELPPIELESEEADA